MVSSYGILTQVGWLWERATTAPLTYIVSFFILFAVICIVSTTKRRNRTCGIKTPPSLQDKIPFFHNAYQYFARHAVFLARVKDSLKPSGGIIQFRMGPKRVYMVSGQQNVQLFFRPNSAIRNESIVEEAMGAFWNISRHELEWFRRDRSGVGHKPEPGYERMLDRNRHWAISHQLYDKYLANRRYSDGLAKKYHDVFSQRLQKSYPRGEWMTVSLWEMLKRDMAEAAVMTVNGSRILELNPGFIEAFWEVGAWSKALLFGVPRWMNPRPWKLRERFHAMTRRYLEAAWAHFDWDGPEKNEAEDWDEHFGSRANREMAKWLRDSSFCMDTQAGAFAAFIRTQLSNTIPSTFWAVEELVKDPDLFQAVRAETKTALFRDPETGDWHIDAQKLLSLPLLQSIVTETLRLHVCVNITREVAQPTELGGFRLERGSLLQASSRMTHYDGRVWDTDGHPASEFWAARHIKYSDGVERGPRFQLAAPPGNFFPFGGGIEICPGRNFVRQEIMITLAILATRFDVEFVKWTCFDGSESDREARHDDKFHATAAMHPDRDMVIRLKRLS